MTRGGWGVVGTPDIRVFVFWFGKANGGWLEGEPPIFGGRFFCFGKQEIQPPDDEGGMRSCPPISRKHATRHHSHACRRDVEGCSIA
jgi:hypothetical protein